jgi:hypothetical protein
MKQMNAFSNPFNIVVWTTLNASNTRVVLISWNSNVEISLYWATHYNGTISKQFLQKEGEMHLIRFYCLEDNASDQGTTGFTVMDCLVCPSVLWKKEVVNKIYIS